MSAILELKSLIMDCGISHSTLDNVFVKITGHRGETDEFGGGGEDKSSKKKKVGE